LLLSEYGWTKTHAFFAIMGGFLYLENDGRRVAAVSMLDAINGDLST